MINNQLLTNTLEPFDEFIESDQSDGYYDEFDDYDTDSDIQDIIQNDIISPNNLSENII